MDITALLLGAGIAVGSALLGVLTETARGLVVRHNLIHDHKKAFMHRTAIELQETVYRMYQVLARISALRDSHFESTNEWDNSAGDQDHYESVFELTAKSMMLKDRIDNPHARQMVIKLNSQAQKMTRETNKEDSDAAVLDFANQSSKLNELLGEIVRETYDTSS